MKGQVFPQLCVTAVVVPGDRIGSMNDDGVRFLENKQITGAIPEMVDEAVGFVGLLPNAKTPSLARSS